MAAHGLTPTEFEEALTPELALVDPALARHARFRLPEPDDTLARLDALIRMSRVASLARRSLETSQPRAPALLDSARQGARIRSRRWSFLGGGVAAGALVIALLVGVRIDVRGTPAAADTTVGREVPAPSAPSTPRTGVDTPAESRVPDHPASGDRQPRSTTRPQRFAWAPAPGASTYQIELFRGSSKVFEAETKRPAFALPARWVFDRRPQTLEPGTYRWYVWPVSSGTRASRAIVQSSLFIPSR